MVRIYLLKEVLSKTFAQHKKRLSYCGANQKRPFGNTTSLLENDGAVHRCANLTKKDTSTNRMFNNNNFPVFSIE